MEPLIHSWEYLSLPASASLNEAIRQLHHAAQLVALLGDSLLPKADDDSQSSMQWSDAVGGLLGLPLPLKPKVRAVLLHESFELRLVDEQLRPLEGLHLMGQTPAEALDWLRETIARLGGDARSVRPVKHFTLPSHPLDRGAAFAKPAPELLQELARHRHNADRLLHDLAASFDHASAIRIWPHHFDTGLVLTVALDPDGQARQTVGVGLAIPDEQFDEPYWYVNHWSAGGDLVYNGLPDLPGGGRWHHNGWTGAVLHLSHLLQADDAPAQQAQAQHFLRAAVNASLEILGQVRQEV